MSERIYGAISVDMRRRMQNWARARAGLLAGMNIAFSSIYDGPIRVTMSPEPKIPTLEGDAEDVTRALQVVPARYRQAVELFWGMEGASLRRLAKRCGKFGVNHETFEAWVLRGHELLVPLLARHQERCRDHQAQIRVMGAGA